MKRLAAVLIAILTSCASGRLQPDPTPQHPRPGCFVESLYERSRGLLPRLVTIVGTYLQDESQWLALVPGYAKALPIPKEQITFTGCSPAADTNVNLTTDH